MCAVKIQFDKCFFRTGEETDKLTDHESTRHRNFHFRTFKSNHLQFTSDLDEILSRVSVRRHLETYRKFVLGIICSIFLYRNSFTANQSLALTRKSFRIALVSLCAVQQVLARRMFRSNGFDTMHVVCTYLLCVVCTYLLCVVCTYLLCVVCTYLLCVVCIGLLSAEFSTVNTGLGRLIFWKARDIRK